MGRTLNLVSHTLSDVRRFLDADQPRQAVRLLRGLVKIAETADAPGCEIYQLLGEAYLHLGQHRLARRYLRRALQINSQNAQALYDLARAIESDPQSDASAAGKYYNRAVEISPQSVCLLADAGAYFVQMGRERKGLSLLARAADLAPNDVETLQTYVGCLSDAGRFAEARRVLDIARFTFRSESVLAELRDRVEFDELRQLQQASFRNRVQTAEPVLLPYLRIVGDQPVSVRAAKYRQDKASKARPHLFRGTHRFDAGRSG
jgi:Tfp pilus assembly protein PilF